MRQPVVSLLVLLLLFCGSGARCVPTSWPKFPGASPSAPTLLPAAPSKRQILDVVNRNTARVRSFVTNDAKISIAGLPTTLRARIAIQPPRRFRLKAGTGLTGAEIDLGSNEQLFWLWVARSRPAAVLFCRHDQFAAGAARQMVPIEPGWLIDAMGLPSFGPEATHSGPYQRPDGMLEIRSRWASPAGDRIKITVVEEARGRVLEQHLITADGRHLASAFARGHHYDPAIGISLPTRVQVQMPPAGLSLTIDVGHYVINQPIGDPRQMWTMPGYPGFAQIDLARVAVPPTWSLAPASPGEQRAASADRTPAPLSKRHGKFPFRWHRY